MLKGRYTGMTLEQALDLAAVGLTIQRASIAESPLKLQQGYVPMYLARSGAHGTVIGFQDLRWVMARCLVRVSRVIEVNGTPVALRQEDVDATDWETAE